LVDTSRLPTTNAWMMSKSMFWSSFIQAAKAQHHKELEMR
jgi:hypothetical protein